MKPTTPPEIGIHKMSFAAYQQVDAISRSQLINLKKSPAHAFAAIHTPVEETDAMIFGSALHTAILEADKFEKRYWVRPKLDLRKTADKEEHANLIKENHGKIELTANDLYTINQMCASAKRHPFVVEMLSVGQKELSAIWQHNQQNCKARIDLAVQAYRCICDLKTTEDCTFRGFQRSIMEYSYHVQGAMYLDGWNKVSPWKAETFCFICIEKSAPYACAAFSLHDTALKIGRDEYELLLADWQTQLIDKHWSDVKSITLPQNFINNYGRY